MFASLDEARDASAVGDTWQDPDAGDLAAAPSALAYEDRLARLPDCENYDGEGACKMNGIIIEGANRGEPVEVWRRDR